MPRKTEYCIAARINGVTHRAWSPRKADAVAFGKALGKLIDRSVTTGIEAVCVADVAASAGDVAYHAGGELWPE